MSRWLFAACCLLCLLSFGFVEPARSLRAHALGGDCSKDRDCQLGLTCAFIDGVIAGQCTAECNATASCQERFGEESLCLGADICARACKSDQSCPTGSICNSYGWCEGAEDYR